MMSQPTPSTPPAPAPAVSLMHPQAAGLDVGAAEVYACVPSGCAEPRVRRFGTYTPDLHALAEWLVACQVDTVALESTGVYWIPVYEILTAHALTVEVVNAQHLKNVPGRKSDVQDCQWIQQLHSFGLLRGSFRPPEDLAVLRDYLRQRERLLEARAAHSNHMQQALIQMNLRLPEVLSDLTGQTGMAILRAIVAGERDATRLAALRQKTCQHPAEDFVKALTGHYRAEHVFALTQALALYDAYTQQLGLLDAQIERQFAVIKPAPPPAGEDSLPPLGPPRKHGPRSKNAPAFDARAALYRISGVDLTAIDGLGEDTVQTILAEVGTDMSRFPTVKHFCSWLSLAPHNDISGGKVLRSRTLPARNRAGQAFRLAAQSVGRTATALGAFYRRLCARKGPSKAIVATAHKIAKIVYLMLKQRQPYHAVSAEEYDHAQHDRELKSLTRRAARLGLKLAPT